MKLSIQRVVLLGLLQACAASVAFASDKVEKRVAADNSEKFAQTAQAVRADMGAGGRYEFIKPADRAKVEDDLNAMGEILQKAPSVAALSQQDQLKLFNTQENLNGILTHSDRDRMVCERRAPVGTNIPINTCNTVGEIEIARRVSEKYMTDHSRDANINHAAIMAKDMGH